MSFAAGTGTLGDPYQIETWDQFIQMGDNLSSNFILNNDIDALGLQISQIHRVFTGTLNGNGHVLKNYGLGYLFNCDGATIHDLKIYNKTEVAYTVSNALFIGLVQNTIFYNITCINACFVQRVYNCDFDDCNILMLTRTGYFEEINKSTFDNCYFEFNDSRGIGNNLDPHSSFITTAARYTGAGNVSTFTNCSLIVNIFAEHSSSNFALTLSILSTANINCNFNKCYFGGNFTLTVPAGTCTNYNYVYPVFGGSTATFTDCVLNFDYLPSNTITYTNTYNYLGAGGTFTRCLFNSQLILTNISGIFGTYNSSCYYVYEKIVPGITVVGSAVMVNNSTKYLAATYTNLDLATIWEISENVSVPKLRNIPLSISELTSNTFDFGDLFGTPVLTQPSLSIHRFTIPKNALGINTTSITIYKEGIEVTPDVLTETGTSLVIDLVSTEGLNNVEIVCVYGSNTQTITQSYTHYTITQKSIQTINVVSPNYVLFNNASNCVGYIHGSIIYNGYIYGVTRIPAYILLGSCNKSNLVKVKCSDYTDITYKKVNVNKTTTTGDISYTEQIKYCNGFLWTVSHYYIIRINPTDLDYILFVRNDLTGSEEATPIGIDERYIYLSPNDNSGLHYKIDTNVLLGSFASYSYDGTNGVPLPEGAVVDNYDNSTQGGYIDHPQSGYTTLTKGWVHSVEVDATHVYFIYTTGASPVFNPNLGLTVHEIHKVDKLTMNASGWVTIPKTTDDTVQTATHLFLSLEHQASELPQVIGYEAGLIAVRKSDMQLLLLSKLVSTDTTISKRTGFGMQYFGNFIALQNIDNKYTTIIDITDVDNWNMNYPIGKATMGRFQLSINGVVTSDSLNELQVDTEGNAHVTTWQSPAYLIKFPLSSVTVDTPLVNAVNIQTILDSIVTGTVTFHGYIIYDGDNAMTETGFLFGTDPDNLTTVITNVTPDYDYTHEEVIDPGIYYFKAYGINSEGTWYGNIIDFSIYNSIKLSNDSSGVTYELNDDHYGFSIRCYRETTLANGTRSTMQDADGNTYPTIVIDGLEWMMEDLKVTHYNNHLAIPVKSVNADWEISTTPAISVYSNDWSIPEVSEPSETPIVQNISSTLNCSSSITVNLVDQDIADKVVGIGLFYNGRVLIDVRGICPSGWHVPTYTEFQTLMKTVSDYNYDRWGWYSKLVSQGNNGSGLYGRDTSVRTTSTGAFGTINQFSMIGIGRSNSYTSMIGITKSSSIDYNNSYPINYGTSVRLIKDDSTDPKTVTDYDGNIYPTGKIGDQVWMLNPLMVTHYNNGDVIPEITDNTLWKDAVAGGLCAFNNDWSYVGISKPEFYTTTTTTVTSTTTTTIPVTTTTTTI